MATLNGVAYEATGICADCGRTEDKQAGPWVSPQFLPGDWNRKVTLLCGACSQKPENQGVRGAVCSTHFDGRRNGESYSMADVLACADCEAAHRAAADRIQATKTIDPARPYGAHIALTCVNHPDLRWHTKNIDGIGARTIFFDHRTGSKCPCPAKDLRVA